MTQLKPLNTGIAAVIGIDKYSNGIPQLKSAVSDAKAIAKMLETTYKYQVLLLLDEAANSSKINQFLGELKQSKISLKNQTLDLAENDRFFFYFAGHGIALDGLDSADGPKGFLVPQDGKLNRGKQEKNLLAMTDLHDALIALPCRHLLVTLDCCFGGSFRWAALNRDFVRSQKLYRERYQRFTNSKAQQVITSAAYDEKALDSVYQFSERGEIGEHSPFAEALLKGLAGEADFTKDGVITATELYAYLQSKLGEQKLKQTPSNFQLKNHDKGEYIFPVPNFNPKTLRAAPKLDEASNPYQGLASFNEKDKNLFFGRKRIIDEFIYQFKEKKQPGLIAILGPSGAGKSSLVKAGLLPPLRGEGWYVVNAFRPSQFPFMALAEALFLTVVFREASLGKNQFFEGLKRRNYPSALACKILEEITKIFAEILEKYNDQEIVKALSDSLQQKPQWLTKLVRVGHSSPPDKLLLAIDQFEELITDCPTDKKESFLAWLEKALKENAGKVRVIVTLRSDFKGQFSSQFFEKNGGEFLVPMMTQDEYREIIEKPAAEKVLYFEPPELVDKLINEVVLMPGALPLLSFTLSELYFKCCDRWQRDEKNRALTLEDYQKLGGVTGALKTKATDVFNQLIKDKKAIEATIRDVVLRMVAVSGHELARRRVPEWELVYPEPKNREVEEIVKAFVEARLLVKGTASDGEPYVEPAHDALVNGWDKILIWKNQQQQNMLLRGRLTPAAREWQENQRKEFLWDSDPYLDALGEVLKSEDSGFNAVEEEFVKKSIGQRRWNLSFRGIMTAVVIMFLGGLATVAQLQRIEAVRQKEIALARQLAAESQTSVTDVGFQDRGTLLALESLKKFQKLKQPLGDADAALRRGLSLLPDFISEINHDNRVIALAFSRDGKYLATASYDKTARVWDIINDKEVAKLKHDAGGVIAVAFSPDGKYLATASYDKTARVWEATTGSEVAKLSHDGTVWAVAFSPDGKYAATASDDKTARVWDAATGKQVAKVNHDELVRAVAFSADGKYVATASDDYTARVWDATTGEEIAKVNHDDLVKDVAFSPDGKYIATASDDKTAKVWDATTGAEIARVNHDDKVNVLAFSSDGKYLATASWDYTAWVSDATTGQEIARVNHDSGVIAVAFSPDGKYLATASYDNTARVWDAATGQEIARVNHDKSVNAVAFSPDGKYLATASADNTARVLSPTTKKMTAQFNHDDMVWAVAFSPDGKYVVTASWDKTARVLETTTGKEVAKLSHDDLLWAVAFSPDGKYVATASDDNTARVWDAATGSLVAKVNHDDKVRAVAFSPDGKYIATASYDNTARVWDAVTGSLVAKVNHDDKVNAVAFSADGKYIATASGDHTAGVWDATTEAEVARVNHDKSVNDVAFSRDGKYLATASSDNTARVWDAATGQEIARVNHDDWVRAVTFSPDGKYVATASDDYTARVWDAATDSLVAKINHDNYVSAVAFSSDGKHIATASYDKTAGVWDAVTGQKVARVNHDDKVRALAFSPDGKYLATASSDRTARVHFLKPEDLRKEACRRLPRNLTADEWERFMNLDLQQYEKTCDNLPVHRSVNSRSLRARE